MSYMSEVYAKLIRNNLKTLEEVPEPLRDEVAVLLDVEDGNDAN